VIVYNPPVVNLELGVRESYVKAAVRLAADLVLGGVTTLVFGQSRNNVETMLKYLRERLARENVPQERVAAYRGGYLPELRRGIEQALRDGSLACVVATSALELGIDIGALDAVVCAGYPGTLSGLWQRFGRGGRRGGESLSLLVASSAPLDQYVARETDYVLGAPIEHARIDPDNAEILVQHVKCGAFELPFESGEPFGDLPAESVADALQFLSGHGLLHAVPSANSTHYHWASDAYPASNVSLRSVGWDNFVVVDVERDASIAEMDFRSTHTMLHEQAIYQQEGEQYQVERLDFENHKAFVRKVAPDYFTTAMTYVRVSVLEVSEQVPLVTAARAESSPQATAGRGDVSVVEKVIGYKKIKYHTHENVGYGEVNLPEMQMHTTAFWLNVPEAIVRRQAAERPLVIDAMRGIAHALHTVASVGLMADGCDVGHTLEQRAQPDALPEESERGSLELAARFMDGHFFDPTIVLYDRIPGGIGLAPRMFDARDELLRRARAIVERCACERGCPACVGPAIDPVGLAAARLSASRKAIAVRLLEDIGVHSMH
jgi:DEAD/DEAH box helicase domain-containing protein